MAYWFHRSVLKATAPVSFDLKLLALDSQALQLCSEIRLARAKLLDLLCNPNNEASVLDSAFENYLSYFQGFLIAVDEKRGQSKLRHAVRFRWTQTMLGNAPISQQDAVFEMVSVCQDVAIWFMKHASMLAGKDEISMEEAKEIHRCLRKAAGLFSTTQENYIGQLLEKGEAGSDLDSSVVNAYINQCTAEAQEVTIARAIELKHSPSLISALANETSKMFLTAAQSVGRVSNSKFEKWKKYLELKSMFYLAYAYCFAGENLLAQEKCGEAIRSLKESEKFYEASRKLSKEYNSLKGPGVGAKVDEHLFFRKLGPLVKRTLEKCERENGFIFHQRVPPEPVKLELKATYGLVSPEQLNLPPINQLWTPATYAAFDTPKHGPNDPTLSKQATKAEGDLTPVKEANVHQTKSEPNNSSGCSLQ